MAYQNSPRRHEEHEEDEALAIFVLFVSSWFDDALRAPGFDLTQCPVAGLGPAIHVLQRLQGKTWVPGTSPALGYS
jgi:hypothetical protein